jgi:hypothetical protein
LSLPASWPDGWFPVDEQIAAGLEGELKHELHRTHALYGLRAAALARRFDCDDVLFLVRRDQWLLAEVHLTWSSGTERNGTFPFTVLYERFEDWVADQRKRDDA